jgi:hypothetical protein
MVTPEHPLLHHVRVEAANTMANAIIDVINAHVRTHGINDPELKNMLLATLATVVVEINDKVEKDFGKLLADLLIHNEWND